jgi:hypothetical protein
MKRTILLGLAVLCLAACNTTSTQVAIAQGDTTIDAAYNTAAQAYLAAVPNMPAATKAEVKPLLVQAYAYVQAADAAAKVGDAATESAQAAQASALISQIQADLK